MGRSFYLPESAGIIEDFQNNEPVYDPKNNFYYIASRSDGEMVQTEYRLNKTGTKIHERSKAADYIIGSGNHNRTYLSIQNGFITELPLTWYSDQKKWDLSPGYHSNNMRFSRPIVEECMHCHNSFTDYEQLTQNKYNTPLPHGIGCERCHGPGQLHVQSRIDKVNNQKGEIDYTIVNPSHLPFQEQLDVCQQCHLQGEISVFKQGKQSNDFRPGMLLSHVKSIFMDSSSDSNEFRIASHAERLAKSACFKESTSLTCITCHNPHVPVQDHSQHSFNKHCVSCHELNALSLTNSIANHRPGADCIQCHMPQGNTADIPHVNFTDHKIQISNPPAIIQKTNKKHNVKKPLELMNYFREKGGDANVQKGIAYVRYYESRHEHKKYLELAVTLFENNLINSVQHISGWYHLGRAYHLLEDLGKAESAYQQTIKFDSTHVLANAQLGILNLESEKPEQAHYFFRRSINHNSDIPVVWNNFGQSLMLSDSTASALTAYDQAITLNPDYATAYNNSGEILLYKQNEIDKAKVNFLSCLKIEPDNIYALHNMSNISIIEGEWQNAKQFAKRALDVDTNFVPSYGTLSTVYQHFGKIDQAREVLLKILDIEPNNADAIKILETFAD
jgi:tetratricopeptide (TPR) repeat protein